MRIKHTVKLILALFTVLGLVATAHAATRGVSDNEIVIGTHTAMSGPVAGWGVAAANATRMRFDEVNAAGGIHGRKIKYIVEDSQYRVPLAVQKANKLLNRDKIFLMIAGIGTPMNNAIFKAQFKLNVPSLFPYSFARSMVQPHHRLKFMSASLYYDQARAGLKYFVEQKGKKRVCLMHVDTDYGLEIKDGIVDQLKVQNMELVALTTHKASETNFIAPITKLRKANCDVIAMGTIIRDSMLPVATARKLGWDVTMFGVTPTCNSIVAEKGGPAMEGLFAVTAVPMFYEEQAETRKQKAFFADYKKRFGMAPSEVAQFAYINADLTIIALKKSGRDLTVDKFLTNLESIKSYKHLFGGPDISFSSNMHQGSNESILMVVKNKRWVSPTGKKVSLSY